MGRKSAPVLLFIILAVIPAHSLCMLEGRLAATSKQNGTYDFVIQVWDKPDADGKAKLMQSIHVPMVSVVNGGFSIPFDSGLDAVAMTALSYKVSGRRFETWEPFRPAEVSRVVTGDAVLPVSPDLVLR
ncbi:MAG TPA: hypothetical protein VJ385_00560 [Fibrobacteria bacterium]|nr:hypothetical protein [Fibrobacteria bacterium]